MRDGHVSALLATRRDVRKYQANQGGCIGCHYLNHVYLQILRANNKSLAGKDKLPPNCIYKVGSMWLSKISALH